MFDLYTLGEHRNEVLGKYAFSMTRLYDAIDNITILKDKNHLPRLKERFSEIIDIELFLKMLDIELKFLIPNIDKRYTLEIRRRLIQNIVFINDKLTFFYISKQFRESFLEYFPRTLRELKFEQLIILDQPESFEFMDSFRSIESMILIGRIDLKGVKISFRDLHFLHLMGLNSVVLEGPNAYSLFVDDVRVEEIIRIDTSIFPNLENMIVDDDVYFISID